jgi:hypothetical protein
MGAERGDEKPANTKEKLTLTLTIMKTLTRQFARGYNRGGKSLKPARLIADAVGNTLVNTNTDDL